MPTQLIHYCAKFERMRWPNTREKRKFQTPAHFNKVNKDSIAHTSNTEPAALTPSWSSNRDATNLLMPPWFSSFITLSACATHTRSAPMSKSRPCAIFAHRVPAGDVAAHESLVKVWPSLGTVASIRIHLALWSFEALSFTHAHFHSLQPGFIRCDSPWHSLICQSFATHMVSF